MMEEDEKPPKVKLPEGIKDLAYITSRKLKSANGEEAGAVVIWRNKGEDEFHYTLKCPYCGAEEESSTVFKRRPYRVRCSNCGTSILTDKESIASTGSQGQGLCQVTINGLTLRAIVAGFVWCIALEPLGVGLALVLAIIVYFVIWRYNPHSAHIDINHI